MFNEGSMRYVCYGSGCAWNGEVVNLWFLSRASEKVADPRGVVAKGAVGGGYLSRLWCFEVGKPKVRVTMMVIIVEVLSFLPKNQDGEDACGEKRVRAACGGSKCGLRRSRGRMMREAKRATCKAGVLSREVAEGSYVVFG